MSGKGKGGGGGGGGSGGRGGGVTCSSNVMEGNLNAPGNTGVCLELTKGQTTDPANFQVKNKFVVVSLGILLSARVPE